MVGGEQLRHVGVLGHGVAVEHAGSDLLHCPPAADLDQGQVDQGQAHAPAQRLGQHDLSASRLVDHPALRDLLVRVADQDRVDARDLLGHQGRGVLGERKGVAVRRRGGGARVSGNHDDIGAGGAHPGHPDPGLLDQAGEGHLSLDVGLVPDRDAGVGQAEDANPDRLLALHLHGLDDVGREGRPSGPGIEGVGAEQREVELVGEGAQHGMP